MNPHDVVYTAFPDGTAALLHPEDLAFHALNGTGARVWAAVVAGEPLAGVVSALAAESGAPRAEVADAVGAFLDELAAAGFPVPSERP
jgi:hypothetical protein